MFHGRTTAGAAGAKICLITNGLTPEEIVVVEGEELSRPL